MEFFTVSLLNGTIYGLLLFMVSAKEALNAQKTGAAIEAGGVTSDSRPVAKASELLDETADLAAVPAHPQKG